LEIERASQRTIALTRQLLSFSRKQVYVPKQVRLSSMIDNMERLIRPLIGENILWNIEAEDDLCLVNIDPGQFEQLVINLIVNARDALGAGGEISISLQNRHVDRELLDATNAPVSPGPYASMSLRDDGCGMEPEVLEHLFEPFFTTKAPGEGTGLGMSTVYGIIKQEKGAIFVQSAPGEGTCFEVLFPSIIMEGEISEPHHTTNSARTPRQPLVGGTEEIVLLEDDEAVLEVVRRMLDNLGYEVHATSNAEEAIETCTRDGSTVSLLITDIVMPNTSGPEVAARIRAKCATLPCIFISGYSSDYLEDQDQIKDVYLLQKPFTPQMLATKIRKVLDKAAVPV
ncbi:MAG: ATP-binding protein, partial [Bradymonadaceae bacterium]